MVAALWFIAVFTVCAGITALLVNWVHKESHQQRIKSTSSLLNWPATTTRSRMTTDDAPSDADAASTTEAPADGSRLLGHALAWREAMEIANAYRSRLHDAVLEDVKAGLSVTGAGPITGLSRMTLHKWMATGPVRPRDEGRTSL